MTHRIELGDEGGQPRIDLQGTLDLAALAQVTALALQARRAGAREVVLVLAAGTEIQRECIAPLRRVEGLRIRTPSAYLARWLRQATPHEEEKP